MHRTYQSAVLEALEGGYSSNQHVHGKIFMVIDVNLHMLQRAEEQECRRSGWLVLQQILLRAWQPRLGPSAANFCMACTIRRQSQQRWVRLAVPASDRYVVLYGILTTLFRCCD